MLSDAVFKTIYTVNDQVRNLEMLTKISEIIFKVDSKNIQQSIKSIANPSIYEAIFSNDIVSSDKNFLKKIANSVNQLIVDVKDMRLVRISLAYSPTENNLEIICGWIKQAVGVDAVIDYEVDPELIGGITIAFQGKYGDYSIKTRLEDYWKGKYGIV